MTLLGYFAARSHSLGQAVPTAKYRHRHLSSKPLMLVGWTLGSDPFSVSALAWGNHPDDFRFAVAGDPRDFDLEVELLRTLAQDFNPWFESFIERGEAPQVIVANRATIEVLWRLGRRFAYLEGRIDDAVVRLARYLQMLTHHADFPGQQLMVSLTDLINEHWAIELSGEESQSLPVLDAYLNPPPGSTGFAVVESLEQSQLHTIGPHPTSLEDDPLQALLDQFKQVRQQAPISLALPPIAAHYRPLLERTWELNWRCFHREDQRPPARYVDRRWQEDVRYYQQQVKHLMDGGRIRTRPTVKAAASDLNRRESALQQLVTEEALSDPLRMLPHLLKHEAVLGLVESLDLSYIPAGQNKRQPRLVLVSPDPCLIPLGTQLWWTEAPTGLPWLLDEILTTAPGLPHRLVFLHQNNQSTFRRPIPGQTACFSVLTHKSPYQMQLPQQTPWTHC